MTSRSAVPRTVTHIHASLYKVITEYYCLICRKNGSHGGKRTDGDGSASGLQSSVGGQRRSGVVTLNARAGRPRAAVSRSEGTTSDGSEDEATEHDSQREGSEQEDDRDDAGGSGFHPIEEVHYGRGSTPPPPPLGGSTVAADPVSSSRPPPGPPVPDGSKRSQPGSMTTSSDTGTGTETHTPTAVETALAAGLGTFGTGGGTFTPASVPVPLRLNPSVSSLMAELVGCSAFVSISLMRFA